MSELLTRVDERTQAIHEQLVKLEKNLTDNYVTKHEFGPVQKIAYGAAGVLLFGVLGAVVALVIR